MDNLWVSVWRKKARNLKLFWGSVSAISILMSILACLIPNNDTLSLNLCLISLFISIISGLIFIITLSNVKIKTRAIGDSIILFYQGVFFCILVIDGEENDRCFEKNYLYGQLFDGKQVCAIADAKNRTIKITVSEKGSDLNIML